MRAKRKALKYYGDTIDYDLDDCCGEYDEDAEDIETEEPVQIPLADADGEQEEDTEI
jgi:hypothetical protein